ncbi:hypothetical protein K443DRAFT_677335 [Laccaria amethystina LaAM-08-1]|uniref:Uncharacterized protein n=1 Tax=Laccaria amethystina LaAM-08-1 TaxID=1095629 RepID=A0A0C9XCW4_9AGAR|nr:hypothetical protein K443DRAFT_677335 [Laccaria amethystina LaAM-08-1]
MKINSCTHDSSYVVDSGFGNEGTTGTTASDFDEVLYRLSLANILQFFLTISMASRQTKGHCHEIFIWGDTQAAPSTRC